MSERIVWNDDEKLLLAAESFRIFQKETDLSPLAAISRAQQKVLPENRRRDLHQNRSLNWLSPMWDQMRARDAALARRAEARQHAEELFEPVAPVAMAAPIEPETVAFNAPIFGPFAPPENTGGTGGTPPTTEPDDARPSSSETVSESASESENTQTASKHRTSVFWRDDEKQKVCFRARSNLLRWPDMKPLEAFRKAQDSELPEDRRRNLTTWEMVRDWAEPMLEKLALDEQIEAARQHEENERIRAEERAEAAEREAALQRAEVEEKEAALAFETAVQTRMETLTLDDMFKAMARRMAREFVGAFSAEIEGVFASKMHSVLNEALGGPPTTPTKPEPPAPVAVESHRPKLPRVCVVGLLNKTQEDDVEKAFLGSVEFVFVKSQGTGGNGGGGKGMLQKAQKCDVVVGMIDWAGHGVDEAAKKLHDIPYKRVAGSVSALKRWLHMWLEGDIQKAA